MSYFIAVPNMLTGGMYVHASADNVSDLIASRDTLLLLGVSDVLILKSDGDSLVDYNIAIQNHRKELADAGT